MKRSHIILSFFTILVVLAGVYFFTDIFGDREARNVVVDEGIVETPTSPVQINRSIPQVTNDPDAGVLINDQNIQIEREDVPRVPDETNTVYVESGTNAEVRTANDTTSVVADTSAGSKATIDDSVVENETDTPEMSIPPVPEM